MAIPQKLYRVFTVKGDDVRQVGPGFTYGENVARALANTYKSGPGSRGRDVLLVPVSDKGRENWKKAVKV